MSPPLGSEQSCGPWRSSPTTACRSWPTPRQVTGSAATSSISRPRKTVSAYEAVWSRGGWGHPFLACEELSHSICTGNSCSLWGVDDSALLQLHEAHSGALGTSTFSPSLALELGQQEFFTPLNPVMWLVLPSQGSPARCSSWAWTYGLPPGRRQGVFWTTGQSQGLLGVGEKPEGQKAWKEQAVQRLTESIWGEQPIEGPEKALWSTCWLWAACLLGPSQGTEGALHLGCTIALQGRGTGEVSEAQPEGTGVSFKL